MTARSFIGQSRCRIDLRRRLAAAAGIGSGIVVEDKGYSLALHYRKAPEHAEQLRRYIAAARTAFSAEPTELLLGKAMFEVKRPGISKGESIRKLMAHLPFSRRMPVFIGDDVTDEFGIRSLARYRRKGFWRLPIFPRARRSFQGSGAGAQRAGLAGHKRTGARMTDYGLDLAVIGNGRTAALLEPSSRIVWWCLPRYDGDPVFCRLLSGGEDKGFTDVVLERQAEVRSNYVRNTAIVVTELIDDKGAGVRITDFAPRFQIYGRTFRPPQIIRIIEPIGGMPRITIRFRTTHRYGEPVASRSSGSNHIRYWRDDVPVRLTTDAPLSYVENEASFILTRPVHMVFGTDEPFEGSLETTCRDFCERTRDYWLEWVRRLAFSIDWQDEIIRAGITLKLCSYEETGAIVAALTTSIPEVPKSGRNWDYRFCWMRDAFFVVRALNRIGATRTMEDFISYILSVSAGRLDEVRPLYGVVHTDLSRSAPRLHSAVTAATDRCASAMRPSIRVSTMSTAASSWPRRQYSLTAGCLDRAMHRFFTRSSRSASRRRSSRSSPMPASGNTVDARACTRIRPRCAGRAVSASQPLRTTLTSLNVPTIGPALPNTSERRCSSARGAPSARRFRPHLTAKISMPAPFCWRSLAWYRLTIRGLSQLLKPSDLNFGAGFTL